MAKKTSEQLQKEYDDIIINLKRLEDAAEQAQHSLDWFSDAANHATDTEKKRAEYNRNKAVAQKYAYEQTIRQRKQELENNRRVNSKGSGLNGTRTIEDIEGEKYKSGFSMTNFQASLQSKGGMGGKAGIAAGIMNVVGQIVDVASDIYIAEQKKEMNTWMAQQDIYLKTLETGSKIFQRHMKTFGKGMQGALTSTFTGITQGVQEGAYSAASTSVDFATESLTNKFQDQIDRLQMTNYAIARKQQSELENLQLTHQEINGTVGLASGILGAFGPVGAAVGGLLATSIKNITKIQEAKTLLELQKLQKEQDVAQIRLQAIQEAKTQAVETAKEAVSSILDFSKAIENLSLKTDAAAKSMANIIGISGSNVDEYEKFIYNATRNLKFTDSTGKTTYLNKNGDDMLKMQTQYIEASGRNGAMSDNDFVKTFLLGEVIGDDNLAATLLGDMDYFNKSIATGTELIFEMFQEANKAGVSNRKFAKDLQQNLQLAQKYTFKGGTEALMKMSIWAQKVRFNMQGLEGMVDKIQDGGLEGVITQAAKLQVLGGHIAMGADPIAMTYEAWANPEALMKRFHDMTKGMGYFNSKTGEVDIDGAEAMILKTLAETIGMDYKDARAQVTQRIKGEQIDKQLYKNYTDDQKALIYNKAKLGKNGQWEVNVLDKDTNKMVTKNVNDLQESDWNSLMPVEESIENYVGKIYNILNQQDGVTKFSQSVMADETFENLKDNIEQRISDNLSFINSNSKRLKEMVETSNNFVTTQNQLQQEKMVATATILNQELEIINKTVEKFTTDLLDGGSTFRLALDAVAAELGIGTKSLAEANDALCKAIINFAEQVNAGDELIETIVKRAEENEKSAKQEMQRGDVRSSLGHDADVLRDKAQIAEIKGDEQKARSLNNAARGNDIAAARGFGLGPGLRDGIAIGGNKSMSVVASAVTPIHDGLVSANGKPMYSQSATVKPIHDGMVSANGKPMYSQASAVTPIHDGSIQMAKSDPKDVALFAKTGGPFDTLFNGIFNRIDALYEAYQEPELTPNTSVETLPMENTNVGDVIRHQWDIAMAKDSASHYSSSQPMELRISGSLELQSGGQSVDIMGMLRDNPLFIREISRILAFQLSNAQNCGRGTMPIAIGNI